MKRICFLMIASTALLLSSCSGVSSQKVTHATDEMIRKQVLFFTDDENLTSEIPYYDAILELKSKHPESLKHLKVVNARSSEDQPVLDKTPDSPAILVIEDNEVICEIEGSTSKNSIVKPVAQAISHWYD
ncbi:hypothetical protein Q0N12_05765 [Rossellomorea marisflavi]|uniref:hypothetical protein n=2 Tax=Rossellomorea marisflavi TaxID=189381 RepID=UPI0034575209